MTPEPRSTIACKIAVWFASASQVQVPDDGSKPDGAGCSVADLCAEGWHVCESAQEFARNATDCKDALTPANNGPVFFVTRQRSAGMPTPTCDPTNREGTNNVFGCGTFGTGADKSCLPLTRSLRDADCKAQSPPWMCVEGPVDYNTRELADITKTSPARGGVLCCRL